MRILGYTTKGGSAKSLVTREVIAAPIAKDTILIEIDSLNQTQLKYKDKFKDVIEINRISDIKEIPKYLIKNKNVVIDVGSNNITDTITKFIEYGVLDEIDLIVIPMLPGRYECENALSTYSVMKEFNKKIIFAFSMYRDNEPLEKQYNIFFDNMAKVGIKSINNIHVTIKESDIFKDAQDLKDLVINLAKEVDYKKVAKQELAAGNDAKFDELMDRELLKRSAQHLVKDSIMPAHNAIMNAAS